MKKLLLLTCMLLQLFCLDGMAMQAADMRAMGLSTVFSPEIPAFSSLQNEESNYTAELKPIEEKYFYNGKHLFFNKQIVQFKIKLIPKSGVDAQTIEDPEKEGWNIKWDWGQAPFEKPIRDDNGIYSFTVDYNSQADIANYPLDAFLSKDDEVGVRGTLDLYVTHYPEPSAEPEKNTVYVDLADKVNAYAELKVLPTGGSDYWTYEWMDEDNNLLEKTSEPSFTIGYNPVGGLEREIKVRVQNSRSKGVDPWYSETFTYHVFFWEKYKLTLAANQEPKRREWNVLSGKEVNVEYLLENVTQDELVLNPEGDEEGWKADWNVDPQPEKVGLTSYKYTPTYEGTDEYGDETLKLTLTNEEKSPELNDFLVFHVYPEPSIETNKKVVVSGNPYDAGDEVKLEVIPKGGFKDGWNYSWKEGEESTDSIGKTYTVKFDGAFTRTITVTAANVGPEGELWLNKTFEETFIIQFKQPGVYKIELSPEKHHVLEGKEALINVYLKKDGEEADEPIDWVKEGWIPTWTPTNAEVINNEDGTFTFIPKYSDGKEQTLTLTLENDNYAYEKVPTQEITFNVYPEPTATQEPSSDITATIGRPVELKIHKVGGNDDGWSFEWTDGEKNEKNETGIYSLEFDGENYEREVSVKVKNLDPEKKDTWYEKDFTFNVKFKENPYTVELMTIPENTKDVLDGDSVKVVYILKENGVQIDKDSLDNWTNNWYPKVEIIDSISCFFKVHYDPAKDIDSFSVDTLSLTLRNEKSDAFASGSITFNVYQRPSAEPKKDTIEANIGDDVPLKVNTTGGYREGWNYRWMENNDSIGTDDSEYMLKYDETQPSSRTIQVIVDNMSPNGMDCWYCDTLTFTIHYKNPYTVKLETEPAGKREVLHGDTLKVTLTLQKDGNPEELDDGWQYEMNPKNRFVRNEDGTFSYTAEYTGDKAFCTDTVTLKLYKEGVVVTDTLVFNVYPKATAEKIPADNPVIAYTNVGVTLSVDYHGGNPKGWEFEWTEGDEVLGEDDNIEVKFNNSRTRKICVTVTNEGPNGEKWFGPKEFVFNIEFKEPLSYEVELSVDDENVLDGNDVQLSFTLYKVENESRSEVKDLDEWTLTWDPVDLIQEKGGKYFFTAQCQEDGESCEQTVTLTLKKDEFDESDSVTVTIWPQPVIADGQGWLDAAEFKDLNNPLNKLQKGIRAGNKLGLPEETPDISINHEWEGYEWKYVWSVDGKEYDDVVDIPTKSDDQYSLEITCLAQYTNGKDVMWEKVVGTRTLNVFKMPPTPTYFVQKGNGTSNTWIISGFKKESSKDRLAVGTYKTNGGLTEVKAISESINATITENGTGWFIMEGHRDAKDLCLYTVRDYGDNVVITSDILPVNLTSVVKWDGSTYENRGILPQSAPSVTGVYSIDGVKTSSMVRGLNIIRLEDGTVRKVFKK